MKFKSNAKCGEPEESGTIFEGRIGNLRVSVHRIIHLDGWFLSCPTLQIKQMGLESEVLMDAINEAKGILKNTAEGLQKDANAFYKESIEISQY